MWLRFNFLFNFFLIIIGFFFIDEWFFLVEFDWNLEYLSLNLNLKLLIRNVIKFLLLFCNFWSKILCFIVVGIENFGVCFVFIWFVLVVVDFGVLVIV